MMRNDREARIARYAYKHLEEQIDDSIRYEEPGLSPEEEQIYHDVCEVLDILPVTWPEGYIHGESAEEQEAKPSPFQIGDKVKARRDLKKSDMHAISGYVFHGSDEVLIYKDEIGYVSAISLGLDEVEPKFRVWFHNHAFDVWVYPGWIEKLES